MARKKKIASANVSQDFNLSIFGDSIFVTFKPVVLDSSGNEVSGSYCRKEKKIEISLEANKYKKDISEAFLHEFIHSVIHRLGLYNAELSHDLEEILCDTIAVALSENFDFEFWNEQNGVNRKLWWLCLSCIWILW